MPAPPANGPQIAPEQYLLIIGAMKCGTTSLFEYLAQHPQICPSRTKEPEYFSEYQGHRSALPSYQALWEFDPGVHRYAMEASTGYTKFPQEAGVGERMRAAGLQPRFIYVLRDPVARIESHIRHVEEHEDQTRRWPFAAEYLLHISNYYLQLRQYLQYYERSQFLLVDFDRLVNAPAAVVREIEEFAGLSPHETYNFRPAHLSATRLQTATPSQGSWASRLRAALGSARTPDRPSEPRRDLADHERAFIHQALRSDMQKLRDEFAFDVSRWGFD